MDFTIDSGENDIPTNFWSKYMNGPYFDREKKLDPISENIVKLLDCKFKSDPKEDMKFKKKLMNSLLSSYFDDLISYMNSLKPRDKRW
jgi:hypothetical protein